MTKYESLSMTDRKGRVVVNYVCSVVAQAALPNPEFKSGEDYLAVDLNVEFPASPVRVRVKCGTRNPNSVTVSRAFLREARGPFRGQFP